MGGQWCCGVVSFRRGVEKLAKDDILSVIAFAESGAEILASPSRDGAGSVVLNPGPLRAWREDG